MTMKLFLLLSLLICATQGARLDRTTRDSQIDSDLVADIDFSEGEDLLGDISQQSATTTFTLIGKGVCRSGNPSTHTPWGKQMSKNEAAVRSVCAAQSTCLGYWLGDGTTSSGNWQVFCSSMGGICNLAGNGGTSVTSVGGYGGFCKVKGACKSENKEFANRAALTAAGWSVNAFDGIDNLKGQHKCDTNHFHAYKNGNGVGVASKILFGTGNAKLEYGNCWDAGRANVYLNGKKISSAPRLTRSKTVVFAFKSGDKLEVKDEEGNAVIQLIQLTITCTPPTRAPSRAPSRSYAAGKTGEDACPTGYRSIKDTGTCKTAAKKLGYKYYHKTSDLKAAKSLCNYCGGCPPKYGSKTVRVDSTHGRLAKWICMKG